MMTQYYFVQHLNSGSILFKPCCPNHAPRTFEEFDLRFYTY